MVKLGIEHWVNSQEGEWWIVSLPHHAHSVHDVHDAQIATWCDQQFGYVDKGVLRPHHSQDFWFKTESEALQCWLTWAP